MFVAMVNISKCLREHGCAMEVTAATAVWTPMQGAAALQSGDNCDKTRSNRTCTVSATSDGHTEP